MVTDYPHMWPSHTQPNLAGYETTTTRVCDGCAVFYSCVYVCKYYVLLGLALPLIYSLFFAARGPQSSLECGKFSRIHLCFVMLFD